MKKNKVDGGLQICLNGASPDSENLGVCALSSSTIVGIASRLDDVKLTVFGLEGRKKASLLIEDMQINYDVCGLRLSRRYYRRDSLWNMRVSAWFGGLGNRGVNIITHATAMLDISGGDSFTDLYGKKRFTAATLPKLFAIQQKCPLILLPQTYGPFNHRKSRNIAQKILKNTTAAWARDERSFNVLQDLLGNDFDPSIHHKGVDVAFLLPVTKPVNCLSGKIFEWIRPERQVEVIGFNISGLIYNDPEGAVSRYGFKADYRQVVEKVLRRILSETDVNVLLIPHVYTKVGHYESDLGANSAIMQQLVDIDNSRIDMLSPLYNESETKWIISKLDWFCGTRMHSTIASLSTGVPTTAIAYSLKTLGVFETCAQGGHVVDPRELSTEDVIDLTFDSFSHRVKTRKHLAAKLPGVLNKANEQMDNIVLACLGNK